MSVTQNEKAARFRALHDGPGAFVIPNPWDVGSARILAGLGFQALATSSAASASSRREETAMPLPVSLLPEWDEKEMRATSAGRHDMSSTAARTRQAGRRAKGVRAPERP